MEGFFINKAASHAGEVEGVDRLKLLAKSVGVEVMRQEIPLGATVWLVPAGNAEEIEFFFIHKGEIQIEIDGESVRFIAGESFYAKGLKKDVLLKTTQDTEIIYVSTIPVFDAEIGFQAELTRLVEQINEKDHYTFRHSRNVMRYAVKLYERLKRYCPDDTMNGIVVASLFHDVGKCRTPDDILKKKARLTPEEYKIVQRHPLDGADLLRAYFDERIVELAVNHHERLDGSGYPRGLKADQLSFEARILGVADAFDAMTTNRGYNRVKSFEEAAAELRSMPEQYDERVTIALCDIVQSGAIRAEAPDG